MTFTGPVVKEPHRLHAIFGIPLCAYAREQPSTISNGTRRFEGYNSYTQSDLNLSPKQTATVSLVVYPQKLQYMGLNTFTPQPATADYPSTRVSALRSGSVCDGEPTASWFHS